MSHLIQLLSAGILVGTIYSLMALGFVVIYKSSSVLNFAQGDFLIIGGYLGWFLAKQLHLNIGLTVLVCVLSAAFLGLLIERLCLRPIIGEPILTAIMMTIGLSYILSGVTIGIFGAHSFVKMPEWLPSEPLYIGSLVISQQFLWMLVLTVALVLAFILFFNRSSWGLRMRATAEDPQVAQGLGISVTSTLALAWIIAVMTAFLGGIFLGSVSPISFNVKEIGLKVIPVAILGGLESIRGALIAGLVMGVIEYLATGYLDPLVGAGFGGICPFIAAVIILLVKPYGLYGLQRIERI